MTARVYLVEGPDGTGKTSYVARRVQLLLADGEPEPRVFHNGPEDAGLPGSLVGHYRAQLLDALDFRAEGVSTLIDRSYLSELVYGGLYRGRSRVTPRQARRLDAWAASRGVVMLGFRANHQVRRHRVEARGEQFDGLQPVVAEFYAQHFQGPDSPWVTVDSTSAIVTI